MNTFMRRAHIVRGAPHDLLRAAAFLAGVAWLPLVVLTLTSRHLAGPNLLLDLSVHARCLVAVPAFLLSEKVLIGLCQTAIARFEAGDFVDPSERAKLDRDVDKAERLRTSRPAELSILVLALLHGQAVLWGSYASPFHLPLAEPSTSAEGLWYALVSLPIFLFLFIRVLLLWTLWCWLLWRMSRLHIHLVTTHPDLAGGLQILAEPTRGFALFFLGAASVVAGAWETRMWREGLPLKAFVAQLIVLLIVAEVLALAPLLPFCGALLRARVDGLRDYGAFALAYSRVFRERCLFAPVGEKTLIESSPVQGLADVGNAYQTVRRTRVVPFAPEDALRVLVAGVLPMLILVVSAVPLDKLVLGLLRALVGGG